MIRQDLSEHSNIADPVLTCFLPDAEADQQRDLGLAVVWERDPNVLLVVLHLVVTGG